MCRALNVGIRYTDMVHAGMCTHLHIIYVLSFSRTNSIDAASIRAAASTEGFGEHPSVPATVSTNHTGAEKDAK